MLFKNLKVLHIHIDRYSLLLIYIFNIVQKYRNGQYNTGEFHIIVKFRLVVQFMYTTYSGVFQLSLYFFFDYY